MHKKIFSLKVTTREYLLNLSFMLIYFLSVRHNRYFSAETTTFCHLS